jgi:transcriptional regulator CtsR
MDIIKIDVPTFLRLLELAREEIRNDADLHDIAEIVTRLSKRDVITMKDYKIIVSFMKTQGTEDELDQIRRLGGF